MAYTSITQAIRARTGGEYPPKGTPAKFAKSIGAAPATVTRWRSGVVPGPEWWPRLAELLDLSVAEVEQLATHPQQQDWRSAVAELRAQLDALHDEVNRAGARLTKRVAVNERRLAALEDVRGHRADGENPAAGG